MTVLNLGEILDRAQDYECLLESYYADLRDRATRDGTRLLTYYLARHRRHLLAALRTFSSSDLVSVQRTPFKYNGPGLPLEANLEERKLPADAKAEQLLDAAIELVEALASVYRWVAEQDLGTKPTSLFRSLLKMEETHVVELKKIRAMDYF
ncbi:MAG: ferritin family protein [Planctomycetota bacterium]|jgi:rubrerythrin